MRCVCGGEKNSKTHYMGFPASIEPCAVSMCGAGGSPHSVGRGRLDAQLVVLHAFPHQVAERMHGVAQAVDCKSSIPRPNLGRTNCRPRWSIGCLYGEHANLRAGGLYCAVSSDLQSTA